MATLWGFCKQGSCGGWARSAGPLGRPGDTIDGSSVLPTALEPCGPGSGHTEGSPVLRHELRQEGRGRARHRVDGGWRSFQHRREEGGAQAERPRGSQGPGAGSQGLGAHTVRGCAPAFPARDQYDQYDGFSRRGNGWRLALSELWEPKGSHPTRKLALYSHAVSRSLNIQRT